MNLKAVSRRWWLAPVMGAALTILCGFLLQELWANTSYDFLQRFGVKTNNVVVVTMDDASFSQLQQSRTKPWDRKLHAKLLERIAEDQGSKPSLVILDVFFEAKSDEMTDNALATAMRRQGRVLARAKRDSIYNPRTRGPQIRLPVKLIADAAAGIGLTEVMENAEGKEQVCRQLWPFPSPYPPSENLTNLVWLAAQMSGAKLSAEPEERWLHYYGNKGNWTRISYYLATNTEPGFFRDKIVFIGQEPPTQSGGVDLNADDRFRTPYGNVVGGVDILATTYLNLVQGDWLRRLPGGVENAVVVIFGMIVGAGLTFTRRLIAAGASVLALAAVAITAVCLSYYSNYWFDWMTLAGAQLPFALAWAWVAAPLRRRAQPQHETIALPRAGGLPQDRPETPDYDLVDEPFGSGAYGRVWLARNAIGQWQALKAVYMSGFKENRTDPYDREFKGITRYKPVSERHPGLLRIDFISQKKPEGYFYYVMELGDSLTPGWEENPSLYKPKDLFSLAAQNEKHRLPALECIRIALDLSDALEFLHQTGLTHRDIKPQNIIFVGGRPKLADVGLVAEILLNPLEGSWVGTPGYMPMGEPPGTPLADIYGLGMVLYVIRTGCDPGFFPTVSNTLADQIKTGEFTPLNNVILKACNPDITQRYASVRELRDGLLEARRAMGGD